MTNVKPSELNYDAYTTDIYDRDIVNVIPFHRELHEHIADFVKSNFDPTRVYEILDLGTGTGITARVIQDLLPHAKIDAVDFSEQMIAGAQKKLGDKNIRYIIGDYSEMVFDKQYDMVISVVGIHHQDNDGKQKLFKKIYSFLKSGGTFIFGDLVTYTDKKEAARNNALHFHHLVERATDEKMLAEWAYHHTFLNDCSMIEDQIVWLKNAGFVVETKMKKFNTALIIAQKYFENIQLECQERWCSDNFIEHDVVSPHALREDLPWVSYETYMRAQLVDCAPGQLGKLVVDFPAHAMEDNELHIHPVSDRVITVLNGSGVFVAHRPDGTVVKIDIVPRDRVWMPRGVLHTFMAGPNGLLVESMHNPYIPFENPECIVYL